MPLTKIKRGGLDTGITDNSDANALTFDSSENALFVGKVGVGLAPTMNLESYASDNSAYSASQGWGSVTGAGIGIHNANNTTNATSNLVFYVGGAGSNQSRIAHIKTAASSSALAFITQNPSSGRTEAMRLDASQNASFTGIITTGAQHDALIVNAPANGNAQIKFQDDGTDKWKIGKQGSGMGFALYNPGTDSNALSFNVSNNDATFAAQGTFNDNLNVVKSASATITIKGNAANANASLTFMEQTTMMWELRADGGASDKLSFIDTGGAEVLALGQDSSAAFGGNVGVGGAPNDEFTIHSSSGSNQFHINADGNNWNLRKQASGGSSNDVMYGTWSSTDVIFTGDVRMGGSGATFGNLGIENDGNATIDLFSNVGSSTRGNVEIFFSTDSSSDHVSCASIVMEQPAGDQAARKGQIRFKVSDNGGPAEAVKIENNLNTTFSGAVIQSMSNPYTKMIDTSSGGDDYGLNNNGSKFSIYNWTDGREELYFGGDGNATFTGKVAMGDADITSSFEFPLNLDINSSTTQQCAMEIRQHTSGSDARFRFKNADSKYVRVGMAGNGDFFIEPYDGSYNKRFTMDNDGVTTISTNKSGGYGLFINNSNATGWGLRIAGGADNSDYLIHGQNESGVDKFVVDSAGNTTVKGTFTASGVRYHTRGSGHNMRASTHTLSSNDVVSGDVNNNGSDITFELDYNFNYQDVWEGVQVNLQQSGNSAVRYNAVVYCYSGYYSPYFACVKLMEFNGSGGTIDGVTFALTSGSSNYNSRKLLMTVQMNSSYKWAQMEGTVGWHRGWN